jgi:hypothetical protein
MVHSNAVSLDEMAGTLLTLDEVRETLAASEPLAPHSFPTGSAVVFTLAEDWHSYGDTALAGTSTVRTAIGGTELQLTKAAVIEAGALCGVPREHQQKIPAALLAAEMNWWYQSGFGDRTFKLLTQHGDTVLGMCRDTINPFSNLALLNEALAGIERQYGTGEVLADYKFAHNLEHTGLRLIIPGQQRIISGTRVADDSWSTGLYLRNSLIGLKPPELTGYLFRHWCTNGCYDTLSTVRAGRRQIREEAEAVEWMTHAVDQVLGGLEHTLDEVQALTEIPVAGDVAVVLGDLFAQHGVPRAERTRVLNDMADIGGDLTMYDVQAAMTRAANAQGLSDRSVDVLLSAGGHIAHGAGERCTSCRRILPEGYLIPEPVEPPEAASLAG